MILGFFFFEKPEDFLGLIGFRIWGLSSQGWGFSNALKSISALTSNGTPPVDLRRLDRCKQARIEQGFP
jgi:hypothetical protein